MSQPIPAHPSTDKGMLLPEGKTCGDCVHLKRCRAFGFTSSEWNTWCDFAPSRFFPMAAVNEALAQEADRLEAKS